MSNVNDAKKKQRIGQQINGNSEGELPKNSESLNGNDHDMEQDPMVTGNGYKSSDKTSKESRDTEGELLKS